MYDSVVFLRPASSMTWKGTGATMMCGGSESFGIPLPARGFTMYFGRTVRITTYFCRISWTCSLVAFWHRLLLVLAYIDEQLDSRKLGREWLTSPLPSRIDRLDDAYGLLRLLAFRRG